MSDLRDIQLDAAEAIAAHAWAAAPRVVVDDGRKDKVIEDALEQAGSVVVVGMPASLIADRTISKTVMGRVQFTVELWVNTDERSAPTDVMGTLSGLLVALASSPRVAARNDVEIRDVALFTGETGILVYVITLERQVHIS